MRESKPGLFAQDHNNSSRDYTNPKVWGKNQFNSSFPASLVAYMYSKGIEPVYICADKRNNVRHKYINGAELFKINPLAPNAYYNFEASYPAFDKYSLLWSVQKYRRSRPTIIGSGARPMLNR